MVRHIDDKGFLYFESMGGWDPRVLPSQRVRVSTSRGSMIGVVGCKPPHIQTREEMEKAYKMEDLFIDIGARGREEAEKWGVQIGSTATLERSLERLGKSTLVSGKALDDRLGCAIMVDVARRMAGKELDYTLYFGGTVQEEVGLRGAKVAAFGITPSLALVIDDSIAGDVPGVDEKRAPLKVGRGPGITIMDSGFIVSESVKELLVSAAEEDYIPYQLEVLRGGTTDAASIRTTKTGVPVGVLSVPVRYGHSSVEVVDLQDMVNTVRLVISVLSRLDEKRLEEIR
jgi:endoglucanase